ncbi:MAG: Fe-S-containing protein [Candidatus Binataceae bacterium]
MRIGKFKIIVGAALAVAAIVAVHAQSSGFQSVSGTNFVSIELSAIAPGHAKGFTYTDSVGRELRFILARGKDGQIGAAFDACRQCYSYHRGYKICSGELMCRECGNRYPTGRMSEGKASCVPIALAHRVDSGKVTIKTADLEAGSWLF